MVTNVSATEDPSQKAIERAVEQAATPPRLGLYEADVVSGLY